MSVLSELVSLLELERLEVNLFRGQSQNLGWDRVFGGQVLGQALSAADQTVDGSRVAHSLHAYFLRPGDVRRPIVYEVDRIRDGSSFTTRRVVAIQGGQPIFHLSVSYQVREEGLSHFTDMPEVPPPEDLVSDQVLAKRIEDRLPPAIRQIAFAERPIETRPVEPYEIERPENPEPRRLIWYRAVGELPDVDTLHRQMLAYASDFHFIGTALQVHNKSWLQPNMQVASLDHAMWFHRPFRMDEWLLYAIDSPSTSGARGLVRGQFFSRDGTLVASTMQEGLIRRIPKR